MNCGKVSSRLAEIFDILDEHAGRIDELIKWMRAVKKDAARSDTGKAENMPFSRAITLEDESAESTNAIITK